MEARLLLLAALLAASPLAGCLGEEPLAAGTLEGGAADAPAAGAPDVLGRFNLTPGGANGTALAREFAGSVKTGAHPSPWDFCCWFETLVADEIFQQPQLVALRLTLTWTNEPTNHANLDVAACVPYYCNFSDAQDQSTQMGAQTETIDLVTGRFDWWEDSYYVGARYHNAVVTTGLPFTILAEVVPLDRTLASRSYAVEVPEDGNLFAEVVAPFRGSAELEILGNDATGLPAWHTVVKGAHGSVHELALEPGAWVLSIFGLDGGSVRLHTDRPPADPELKLLTREVDVVEFATSDGMDVAGTYEHVATPGTVFLFAWHDPAEGVHTQVPGMQRTREVVASSTGVVSDSSQTRLALRAAETNTCVACWATGTAVAAPMLDDDGTYTVTYEGTGSPGTFVLRVIRYVMP